MSRVFSDFPDRDEGDPEQAEFVLPASRRETSAAPPLLGEPTRAGFFREQRRPVLPLIGLVAAVTTVTVFLWLGREDPVPTTPAGDPLAPVAAAPGLEPPLPATGPADPGAPPAGLDPLAASPPEPAPMPAVPSVLDERAAAPPVEALPAETLPAEARTAESRPAEASPLRGAFAVQLLAARSEADVGASWERLRGSYPDLLASLTPSVTRTSRAEGETFFRLRAGPLRDRASADALCRALSQREQSCFVVSPGS